MKKRVPASTKSATKQPDPKRGLKSMDKGATSRGTDLPRESSITRFPIVGIGASAGGLAAFEAFFSGMPEMQKKTGTPDTGLGMAFVLVQHLSPDHKSILTQLVQRYTSMKAVEVTDGVVVRPNHVYIIPPAHDMAFLNGTLQLLEPPEQRSQRLTIDFFFRSLAEDLHERAIGIVLSGTGSDGSMGVRAIKGEGGMVMAQTPDSTEFDGMPRSAIATGLVDFELPPAQMAPQLISYVSQAFGKASLATAIAGPRGENALKKIAILLRAQTSHDFSQYKPNTIHRRIERRMAVHQIESIEGYIKFLQQTPTEVDALFRDLLIGVTKFFRDPEVFEVLEAQVIPKLFEGKTPDSSIRLWCTGCSTGEEAYSMAILLAERMETLKQHYHIQIFATDLDSRSITTARSGFYPANIASDISAERLARYFTREADGSAYRVNKSIRDLLVFSEQDVIKDPPFSKLDLISCRNLLIYMGAELQKKLIPLFHYALKPNGWLLLGTSESIGEFSTLFTPIDRKAKLYHRKEDTQNRSRTLPSRFISVFPSSDSLPVHDIPKPLATKKKSLRELTEQALLQQLDIVAALVNTQGDILYLHGRSGLYLEPAPGEAGVNNILKMAREGLRRELSTALHKAAKARDHVHCSGLRVKTNGHYSLIDLSVSPLGTGSSSPLEPSLFLVVLEQSRPQPAELPTPAKGSKRPPSRGSPAPEETSSIAALKEELRIKDEYLQSTLEVLETSTEELKSSNEEMQSVNEELQSSNEELETSKEELQSVNEELATVNAELQTKVADLSLANNDMNNLMAGTGIGTIFVDHRLCILRFTPAASSIINLIASDVGRPVSHIVTNLVGYSRLVQDLQTVLDILVPREIEVQTQDGRVYTMRIQPYRTLQNVIEGAVISFLDITLMAEAREALRKANEMQRLAVMVHDAQDAIIVQNLEGRIIAWNPGAERLFGWTETEALTMTLFDRIPAERRKDALDLISKLGQADLLEPLHSQRLTKDGALLDVSIVSSPLINKAGRIYAIATTERVDLTKKNHIM
jgi:two-component system, chemotaxis family, CheB/CheR fusion protein